MREESERQKERKNEVGGHVSIADNEFDLTPLIDVVYRSMDRPSVSRTRVSACWLACWVVGLCVVQQRRIQCV